MEMTEAELETCQRSEQALKTKYSESQEIIEVLKKDKSELQNNIIELEGAMTKLKHETDVAAIEKEKTEAELSRVNREMAAVDAVVKEMTSQFKQESQSRIVEVITYIPIYRSSYFYIWHIPSFLGVYLVILLSIYFSFSISVFLFI